MTSERLNPCVAGDLELHIPVLRQPYGFDFLVLLSGIALFGNSNESCVNDLITKGLETWERRYATNITKSSSISPALRSRSQKNATVVASGLKLVNRMRKTVPTLRLKCFWTMSILNRTNGSIDLSPALL